MKDNSAWTIDNSLKRTKTPLERKKTIQSVDNAISDFRVVTGQGYPHDLAGFHEK